MDASGSAVSPPGTKLKDIKLDSLNSLRGRVSIILADLLFHQFSEDEQFALAQSLASLLSSEPGSMIFGNHAGLLQAGTWSPDLRQGETESKMKMYCHSPESWQRMWEGIFGEGNADVKVSLSDYGEGTDFQGTFPWNKTPFYELIWSVTRL